MGIFRRIFNKNDDEGKDDEQAKVDSPPVQDSSGVLESSQSTVTSEDSEGQDDTKDTTSAVEGADDAQETEDTDTSDEVASDGVVADGVVADDEDDEDEAFSFIPDGITRPLPSEPVVVSHSGGRHLIFGQATDGGMVRSNNQDSSLAFFATASSVDDRPDFGVFIVADGMGGHHDGEKASAVAIREVASKIMRDIYLPMLSGDNMNDANRPTIAESLTSAIKQANRQVIGQVPDGGTTMTAMVLVGNLAHIGHVGDSRAYLIGKQSIDQMTRDHSLVQRLIELDQLTPKEAEEHHHRNVLYRAIGQAEELEVDTLTRRIPPSSRVLLCSDGLWGLIEDSEIKDSVLASDDPQDACERLIQTANERGGHDNITVVIVSMP